MDHSASPFGRHVPPAAGLYDPTEEHDACGTGFVAELSGSPSARVLALGLEALQNLSHRGAVGSDAHSGDGAGVLTQLPFALFAAAAARLGHPVAQPGDLAVGMLFLPEDAAQRAACEAVAERAVQDRELTVAGWRDVPLDPDAIGEQARATLPVIRQLLVLKPSGLDAEAFDRRLFAARKQMERLALEAHYADFYVCSFSARTIVYKALVMAPQLKAFYADLRDPAYVTASCLFHQRYSTNTFPTWALAQPFRMVAHNGEINTLSGNRNWMAAREASLGDGGWRPEEQERLAPVIQAGGSDSSALDNVLDLLVASGRDVLHSVRMLVPEAYGETDGLLGEPEAFYAYHEALTEPWDGPAALAFADGRFVGACLDRNGLRPARYTVTADGLVVLGSEAGLVDFHDTPILEHGRLGPGQILAVDLQAGRLLHHAEVMAQLAGAHPYAEWVAAQSVQLPELPPRLDVLGDRTDLIQRERLFGFTAEDVDRLLLPMALEGKEPVGSMGDDTPLAVFSEKPRPLWHYFKQRFAQVTNPPIDPLREKRVMSLTTLLGARPALLGDGPGPTRLLRLRSPLLDDADLAWLRGLAEPAFASATLDATWDVAAGEAGLGNTLLRLGEDAAAAVREGATLIVLSDRTAGEHRAPVPMLLAVAALHKTLLREGLRMRAALIAETGQAHEDHHLALLLGYGADAVNPYLGFRAVVALVADGRTQADTATAVRNYRAALEHGLTKIMAKVGICTVSSYRGARVFEALGLRRDLVNRYFSGTASRLGGVDLTTLARDVLATHTAAFAPDATALPDWGLYRYRVGGEYHQLNPHVFKAIQNIAKQTAVMPDLAKLLAERPNAALRDMLGLKFAAAPLPLDEVEPAADIARRFVASAMSLGALSAEAHACVAIAMNRLGAKSNSGEGGEAAERRLPLPNGDSANSNIKQVATGRFGVTPAYLASADELEIKMAQGAKPGEGGQLPGFKVNAEIAQLRHATVGTSLISPPPHHDIYSIEDLAQLIHDLRQVNPRARIAVKLVAVAGVGTIAAGVAKAHADIVHIAGHDGGTGASPLGSIKHAGTPWELGLSEAQQVLVMNGLRARVRLRVDGGLKCGRDILVAALLGADEFGFGTSLVVAAGCIMARQCHQNTCPVGIATQDEALRKRFKGDPAMIVNYLLGVAEDVRLGLAALGLRSLEEAVGRVDLLMALPASGGRAGMLDMQPLLHDPNEGGDRPRRYEAFVPRTVPDDLDGQILAALGPLHPDSRMSGHYPIRNTQRTVGARLAGELAHRFGDDGFKGFIALDFTGTAGQSFGAFCLTGMHLTLTGQANDYVGKGMAGGQIVVRPPDDGLEGPRALIGNTVLYGATGGRLYAAGGAGERFAVRNSGAEAVVEGVGDHGCEYMTRGTVVVLGPAGHNFAAGMTGGRAFVFDEDGDFASHLNPGSVELGGLEADDENYLRAMLEAHLLLTRSPRARAILDHWESSKARFWCVKGHGQVVLQPSRVRA